MPRLPRPQPNYLPALLSLLGLFHSLGLVQGNSNGAPKSACDWMSPWHEPYTEPQAGPAPYAFRIYGKESLAGNLVAVCLVGDEPFSGFMIQAHDPAGAVLGSWPASQLTSSAQPMTCESQNDTVTHVSSTMKQVVPLKWQSPSNYTGEVSFKAAVVKDYTTFWTGVTSEAFTLQIS
ncbi:putative defense protein 1 [Penaeus japonicus]|uniref:putative defense protein 1 n=1 Tax=Penaeus japonicus TaxID=27405 RepID=UPI001C70FBB7|nr:putative defense protein 1 [Penaeus japonicus]